MGGGGWVEAEGEGGRRGEAHAPARNSLHVQKAARERGRLRVWGGWGEAPYKPDDRQLAQFVCIAARERVGQRMAWGGGVPARYF